MIRLCRSALVTPTAHFPLLPSTAVIILDNNAIRATTTNEPNAYVIHLPPHTRPPPQRPNYSLLTTAAHIQLPTGHALRTSFISPRKTPSSLDQSIVIYELHSISPSLVFPRFFPNKAIDGFQVLGGAQLRSRKLGSTGHSLIYGASIWSCKLIPGRDSTHLVSVHRTK